jgi:hypothetical protein
MNKSEQSEILTSAVGLIFPLTDGGLWILRLMICVELFVLFQCVSILVKCYREHKERKRQKSQEHGQPNKRVYQFFGILHNANVKSNLCHFKVARFFPYVERVKKFLNFSWRCLKQKLCDIFVQVVFQMLIGNFRGCFRRHGKHLMIDRERLTKNLTRNHSGQQKTKV